MKTPRIVAAIGKLLVAVAISITFVQSANANGVIDLGSISVPGSRTYGQAYNAPQISFSDLIIFSVPDAQISGMTATIGLGGFLGLSNLQTDLYSGVLTPGGTIAPGTPLVASATVVPLLSSGIAVGAVAQMNAVNVAAGNYILNIQGSVVGLAGGAFSGMINVSPVPEPDAALSLIAGLALIGLTIRRRLWQRA